MTQTLSSLFYSQKECKTDLKDENWLDSKGWIETRGSVEYINT